MVENVSNIPIYNGKYKSERFSVEALPLTALIKCSSAQLQVNRGRTPTCAIHFIYCWQTLLLWKAKRKLVIGAKKESQQNKLTI